MPKIEGHAEAIVAGIHRRHREMAGIEAIPAYLLAQDRWDDFALFLRELPIPERRKKELIVQWANYVGAYLTHDLIEAVLGPLAERI